MFRIPFFLPTIKARLVTATELWKGLQDQLDMNIGFCFAGTKFLMYSLDLAI
jgi:hypothetical protein